jgi:sulfide:quinone oxidoreductase
MTVDIRPFLRRRNIRFIDDVVTEIRDAGRTVVTKNGSFPNDALFLGLGPSFLKDDIPGSKEYTFSPCDGPHEMDAFVAKFRALERGVIYVGFKINRKDGFVAGRAGQMYECAFLLDYALTKKGIRDKFEIHFFTSSLSPGEKGAVTDSLRQRGIVLDYGYEPVRFVEGGMVDADGSLHKADLVLFTPGITGPALLASSCLPVSPGGHIDVDRYGQAKGLSNVFAAGDCASHENPPPWVPHQAHGAQLRSHAAAKNMHAVLKDRPPTSTYRFEISCILNMGNDAIWMHRSSDDRPPFWGIFPRRSPRLIWLKNVLEGLYLFYLRYL